MADTSILALDAARTEHRLRMGKSLTFENVELWSEMQGLAERFRVVVIGEVAT
jgi:hypothetical protein